MSYRTYNFRDIKDNPKFNILNNATEVLLTDNNLKPDWIEFPAAYTEFHIKRNKKNLLVVIGESWAYGETIQGIATGIQKYNFQTQLEFCFGPRLATILDTDLYQYAVPGNCNFYMFTELDRILKHVSTLGYKKIFVCLQMTEPAREQSLIVKLREQNHPLQYLICDQERMTFDHWLEKYDDIFFDQYERIISQYKNVDGILWKNFCKINSKNLDRLFKIIDTTWIQYSSRILGKNLDAPTFYSVGWLDTIMTQYYNVSFDKSALLKEIKIIEESNNFIKASALHSHHPNEFGHLLWAQYLARKSGWKNDI